MAERDTRAMVSAGWWLGTPPQQRQHLIAGRMLALPDGTWWIFGAWGRWYRLTPADGQWHLCPPPRLPMTRMSARPLQQGMPVPQVPPHVVPTGPDLAYTPPTALAFVDAGIRPEITSRARATVESAAALPPPDYPHWWRAFSSSAPSTVALTWGVMLWCATAPVFDSRLDAQMLGLWSPYRSRPLPEIDGPRWLTPPPLESLVGLYTERLRAGRVDAAVVILRTMWAMAGALREDARFQPRADALIAMLGVTLQNPTVDYGALAYGDQAVVQQWLTRCPPALAPALRVEASAGEHFRNSYYDLALAVTPIAGDPDARGYVEPRLVAAGLLAADLAVVRQEVSSQVVGWLDPQVGEAMRAMLIQGDHPLRPFWPEGDRLPRSLREGMEAAGPAVRSALLATMYGADLAWCRLGGGIPARPRGFPSSVAILAEIIGPGRATSATAVEPVSPAPGIAPLAHQYPSNPGASPQKPAVPVVQQPPTGPPGQAPAWAAPAAGSPSSAPAAPPSTESWAGAQPLPASTGPQSPSAVPPETQAWGGAADPPSGGMPGESGRPSPPVPPATQAWGGAADLPPGGMPAGPGGPPSAAPPATQAWSGTTSPPADVPPRTEGWSGGEAGPAPWHGGGDPPSRPPPAEARFSAEGMAPDPAPSTEPRPGDQGPQVRDGAPPPRTAAWPGTGAGASPLDEPERAKAPSSPPATQAWPGSTGPGPLPSSEAAPGARESGEIRPTPSPDVQPPSGGGEGHPGTPAPATRAWSGAESHTPGVPSPDTEDPATGGPGTPAPATRAWSGAESHSPAALSPDAENPATGGSTIPPAPGTGEAPVDVPAPQTPAGEIDIGTDEVPHATDDSLPRAEGEAEAAPVVSGPDGEHGEPAAPAARTDGDDVGESAEDDDATAVDHVTGDDDGEDDDATAEDEVAGEDEALGNVTMMDSADEHVNHPTSLDPLGQVRNATYVDWIGGTRADAGSIPLVPPSPVTAEPPRTRVTEEPEPPERPGTRIMSGTMVGDLLGAAPMPERPVEQIAPPPVPAPMPKVTERFGIRFLSGADDATELFDGLHRLGGPLGRPLALLIVGDPHTGQRRLTRLIARTLAGAGVGDGSVRTADGAELRGDHVTAVTAILRGAGPPLLFERLDRAVLEAADPARVVAAVTSARENKAALIATCDPASYARLPAELTRVFQVFRLPDLANLQTRLALLHVLADERRVTITASGLGVVRADLARLGGHGDLVGARLVEAYLDRVVTRHVERAGAPRDRMVLVPVDFAGVAEEIEPALRPPRDVDGYLRGLDEMIGLDEVKRTVGGLVAEARMAADRAMRGLPSGNPSRHLIFLGRPGTGKATVAGLIGGIYAALNLLDTGQLVVCSARDFAGADAVAKVGASADRAMGGVLLIEDAHQFERMPVAVAELSRLLEERRDKFMVICASLPDEMEGFLLANPGFRAEFGAIIEFREPTERQLVQLFSRLAERDLYMLDEELRVELLDRFAGMRRYPGFAFADTVRRLFEQIVARQAARLSGSRVDPAAVARLSIGDLPESAGGQLLQELHPDRPR